MNVLKKIDGTNIRVELKRTKDNSNGEDVTILLFKGRTDRAIIPEELLERLNELFKIDDLLKVLDLNKSPEVTLYGEVYGRKIQKGGGRYISNGVSFILFDIKIGDF